jgi:hypothetical protein
VATVLFTALQSSPRDVIVAAAFPDSKLPLCRNAGAPGIKPQPDLTEADHVPAAVLFRFLGQRRWGAVFINGLPTGRKQERCQKRTDAH